MFIFFSWDKIYYIFKKKGNDPTLYFIYSRKEKCFVHNSFTCGCKLKSKKENLKPIIEKYIKFYKFCSTVFIIEKGKIKYIKLQSKVNIIMEELKTN